MMNKTPKTPYNIPLLMLFSFAFKTAFFQWINIRTLLPAAQTAIKNVFKTAFNN